MARSMKDSGVEWIGEIPKTWYVARVKTIFKERTELSETGNELLLSVSEYYGIASRASKIGEGEYVTRAESLVGYKKCYKGDLVSNIMLAWKGSLGVSDIDGIVSPAYCVYQPQGDVCPRFFHYLFRTKLYTDRFKLFSRGIIDSRLRLYSPFFYDIEAIIPPRIEQQRIADFLDTRTADIDASIAKTQESIEEYKKLKQAVITQAVTKGIRPGRVMKDSGVEWIGEIPEEWDISKIKYACDNLDYLRRPVDAEKRTKDGAILYDYYGASGPIDKIDKYIIEGTYLLIGEDGANLVLRNLPLVYVASGKYWVNNHAHILSPRQDWDFYFTAYAMESADYFPFITGSAQPKLSQGNLGNVCLPKPELEEQQEIAAYLDEKCAAIDTLIEKKQAIITELEAYKKSLIYEYVTGKKEAPMVSC